MAEVRQTQASALRPGSYIILEGMACVVKDVQKSKTGKHGSGKCRIEVAGIIGGQKKIHLCPSTDNVEVPIIEKKNAQVLSIQGSSATVMDNETFETFDLKIGEEVKDKVKEGGSVTYWIIMDEKVIMDAK